MKQEAAAVPFDTAPAESPAFTPESASKDRGPDHLPPRSSTDHHHVLGAAEVERVLEDHPGVSEAAVVGVPDDRLGEVTVAFAVPSAAPPAPDTLVRWCRDRLASFKVLRHVWIVESLPRGAVEKIAEADLRARDRVTAPSGRASVNAGPAAELVDTALLSGEVTSSRESAGRRPTQQWSIASVRGRGGWSRPG